MANRNFNRKQALEREVKEIYAEIAIGTSGAPTLTRGTGVASISRSSAGLYVLTLQDLYTRLMFADVKVMAAAAEDVVTQLVSENVAGNKTISFRTVLGSAGTVVDPASGDKLFIKLELKNSSVI